MADSIRYRGWVHDASSSDIDRTGPLYSLESAGHTRVDTASSLGLLIGYVANTSPADQRELLQDILENPAGCRDRTFLDWEGNFTLVILDIQTPGLVIYRNFISTSMTYFIERGHGLAFGDCMASIASPDRQFEISSSSLPLLYLYRTIPGPATIAKGVRTLEPGQCLTYASGRLTIEQAQSIPVSDVHVESTSNVADLIEGTMAAVIADIGRHAPSAVNLLSGGVDSSYIQAHWNQCFPARRTSACAVLDHAYTRPDLEYALEMAGAMGTDHRSVRITAPVEGLLSGIVASTGEMPNHVQSCYFGFLAEKLAESGFDSVLCGEGADSLFGTSLSIENARATRWSKRLPWRPVRRLASRLATWTGHPSLAGVLVFPDRLRDPLAWPHPFNTAGAFTDWDAVAMCFSSDEIRNAFEYRHRFVRNLGSAEDLLTFAHNIALFCEGVNTAATWTLLTQQHGVRMFCPFLDSRMVRLAMGLGEIWRFDRQVSKAGLKAALSRHVPEHMVLRPKLGFGQPIFEWLGEDGALRGLVDSIETPDFVPRTVMESRCTSPSWFLYTLLCHDLWRRSYTSARNA